MKNIEKYKETRDALEAFREWYKYHKDSVLTMSGWLEAEYEAPPQPTLSLLEAAEAVVDEWYASDADNVSTRKIVNLENAIDREKRKPVRNCDRFATAEEAWTAFKKMCNVNNCRKCPFGEYRNDYVNCRFIWLYAEADKEETK